MPLIDTPDAVPEADLLDLRERVRRTRTVPDPWEGSTRHGMGADRITPLLERWADGFDWPAQEQRIRALPWQLVRTGAGPLRVVHRRGDAPDAPVVVLLHGWPDSVLRFERLLPLLTDVTVVVPALPGFPFAAPGAGPWSFDAMADLVAAALAELGHDQVVLSGGDVGGTVAEIIAGRHPELVRALHLTDVSALHARTVRPADLPEAARPYLDAAAAWFRAEGGYIAMHATRPVTVLTALGDSPAGLLAWLVDKISGWSQDAERSFDQDEVLTWVSAYWFGRAVGSSLGCYVEPAHVPDRIDVPTVFSAFAADIKPAPRSYVEHFVAVEQFREHETGGHFAAWENPQDYGADLRLALQLGRR